MNFKQVKKHLHHLISAQVRQLLCKLCRYCICNHMNLSEGKYTASSSIKVRVQPSGILKEEIVNVFRALFRQDFEAN